MPKVDVERSILINAPRGKVYATVRDLHQWPIWSPWLVADPECKLDFAPDGRSYSWDSKVIGAGSIAVAQESEGVSIDYNLTFIRPHKSTSKVRLLFANAGEQTKVSWVLDSKLPFFLFWMKRMMVAMIGMDYVRGLGMLKEYAETGELHTKMEFIGKARVQGFAHVGRRSQCGVREIGPKMESDFKQLMQQMDEQGIQPVGAPFSIYHQWNVVAGQADYTIGFPVASVPTDLPLGVVSGQLPDCEVFSIKHTGAYDHLGNAWFAGYARQEAKMIKMDKQIPPFEVYLNDPRETETKNLVTVVHFPIK